MVSRVNFAASPDISDTKHSLTFLLNGNVAQQPNRIDSRTDDAASSSTRTESECGRLDDLLTAAQLLERTPTQLCVPPPLASFGAPPVSSLSPLQATPATLPALSPMMPSMGPLHAAALSPLALPAPHPRNTFPSAAYMPTTELSSCSSAMSSIARPMKRRKKRASVPCEECGRLFGEAAAVRKHKRVVHLKVKDFACDICSRRFAEKSNLKKHVQARHQHTRAHKCDECGKVFNFTDGLRRHINNCHLGLRPYACDICPSSFKQRTHLQKHKQSVHGQKPAPKRTRAQNLPRTPVINAPANLSLPYMLPSHM